VHAPLARLSDPETSHAAAADYKDEADHQNTAIYYALCGMGHAGGDAYAIAERLGEGWTQVMVARRLAGLRQRGLLYRLHATSEGTEARPHKACHVHIANLYRYGYSSAEIMPEPERRRREAA